MIEDENKKALFSIVVYPSEATELMSLALGAMMHPEVKKRGSISMLGLLMAENLPEDMNGVLERKGGDAGKLVMDYVRLARTSEALKDERAMVKEVASIMGVPDITEAIVEVVTLEKAVTAMKVLAKVEKGEDLSDEEAERQTKSMEEGERLKMYMRYLKHKEESEGGLEVKE